jgi:hypothetical protein
MAPVPQPRTIGTGSARRSRQIGECSQALSEVGRSSWLRQGVAATDDTCVVEA